MHRVLLPSMCLCVCCVCSKIVDEPSVGDRLSATWKEEKNTKKKYCIVVLCSRLCFISPFQCSNWTTTTATEFFFSFRCSENKNGFLSSFVSLFLLLFIFIFGSQLQCVCKMHSSNHSISLSLSHFSSFSVSSSSFMYSVYSPLGTTHQIHFNCVYFACNDSDERFVCRQNQTHNRNQNRVFHSFVRPASRCTFWPNAGYVYSISTFRNALCCARWSTNDKRFLLLLRIFTGNNAVRLS